MRPLIWTDWRAVSAVAGLAVWLMRVELGTSRKSSLAALRATEKREQVVDTSTGTLFDGVALAALVCGLDASLKVPRATIRARRSSLMAGLGLLVISGVLSRVARQHLGRFHRHSLTVHIDHEVIDSGPYRVIRHPLYAATIGVFAGMGAVRTAAARGFRAGRRDEHLPAHHEEARLQN